MIVHRPTAVGDSVLKLTAGLHIVLGEDVSADVAARFALAGQTAYPFKLPVVGAVVAVVLYVIPDPVCDLYQLVAELLGIVNRIVLAAELKPPQVRAGGPGRMRTAHVDDSLYIYVGDAAAGAEVCRGISLCEKVCVLLLDLYAVAAEIFIVFVDVSPLRGNELDLVIGLYCLEQAGHAHGLEVCLFVTHSFIEFAVSLASYSEERSDDGCEDRVARAVGEVFRVYGVPRVGRELPADDSRYAAVSVGVGIADRAVHEDFNILFGGHFSPHNTVPERKLKVRVAVDVFLLELGYDTGFAVTFAFCSAYPHTDLARAVAAEHRAVLNKYYLYSFACG